MSPFGHKPMGSLDTLRYRANAIDWVGLYFLNCPLDCK